jgi:8-oxo-dGTP pyrophosphatase MutT (NUDIX family)
MHSLDEIRRSLAARAPTTVSARGRLQAAVAMVLRGATASPDVLFIERARREGDPWSGHMAFPGGRVDPGDPSPRSAAERETLEEVGLDLSRAEPLGRLDDLQGHRAAGVPKMVISAFVYHLSEPPPLSPNHEVREAFWFPVASLHDADRQVPYRMPLAGETPFPGIRVGDPERHVVWGLTYRFLEVFFEVVGRPLSNRWGALRDEV